MAQSTITALKRPLNTTKRCLPIFGRASRLESLNWRPLSAGNIGSLWLVNQIHFTSRLHQLEVNSRNHEQINTNPTRSSSQNSPSSQSRRSSIVLMRRELDHPIVRPLYLAELLPKALFEQDFNASPQYQIRPEEVVNALEILQIRIKNEGNLQRLLILQHIESIVKGLHHCYLGIMQTTESQILAQAKSKRIKIGKKDLSNRILDRKDVRRWKNISKSKLMNQLLSNFWKISSRTPTIEEIQFKISQMINHSENITIDSLQILLDEIVRSLPASPKNLTAFSNWLEFVDFKNLRISWNGIGKITERKEGKILAILRNCETEVSKLEPFMASIKLFEEVWRIIQIHSEPSSRCFASALQMEIRLASYRSLKLGKKVFGDEANQLVDKENEEDLMLVWKPVTDVLEDLQNQDRLNIKLINKVLFATFRNDPNYSTDQFDEEEDQKQDSFEQSSSITKFVWPSLQWISDVYQIMRHNLLKNEKDKLQGSTDDKSISAEGSSPLLGNFTLKRDIVPTFLTYNVMIQFHASRGNLAAAMDVINDTNETEASLKDEEQSTLNVSVVTFSWLFRGFAKFGLPYQIKDGENVEKISESKEEEEKSLSGNPWPWTIHSFNKVFYLFMKAKPRRKKKSENTIGEDQDDVQRLGKRFENNSMDHSSSTKPIMISPTSQNLFFLITALRRVSGDEPNWVISQFVKVAAKFSILPSELQNSPRDADNKPINKEGWIKFRFDERIKRVLEHLYHLRDPMLEQKDEEGKDWMTKFMQEVEEEMNRRESERESEIES